uniref:Cytochrome P450 76C4 n=1 Tax=Aegilops tauschii subsp. strangulata TaxID=200361 RepID=A0A453QCJ1_AEGTS
MELLFFCTIVLILMVSSVYLLGLLTHSGRNLPPGPRSLPLVGNLLSLGALPHRSLAGLAERHGPIMALRLGTVTTVVASSADAARDILQRHDAAFSGRFVLDGTHVSAHYTHSMVWLPASSPRWRALRKVCSGELFAPHRLDMHQSLRQEKVHQLVSHVTQLAREGVPVHVGHLAFTTALNLLSSTIFSTDLADLDDRHVKLGEFKAVLAELNVTVGLPNLSDFIPEVAWLDLQGVRRRMRNRAAGEPTKKNFLDVLLDYRNTDDDQGFERQTLLSLLSDLFSAGTDTSSATVEWAMAELLLNPSSMSRARQELDQVIGSKEQVEESDIGQLKYLQAIVKETFRLHPPAPFLLPHVAETTTQVQGYTIPKGTRLLVNVWAIGHDGKVWPEPEKFMPERFLEKDVDFKGRDFELLPFGSGRRMCPGTPLAVRIVHLMLASLLHRFQWRLPVDVEKKGLDMTERLGVNLSMATPLEAIATPA